MYPNYLAQSQYAERAGCQFTCCFCCSCGYDALCVYRSAFMIDIILFSLWIINFLADLGNGTLGLLVLLYLLIAVVVLAQCILASYTLCKYQTFKQTGVLRSKTELYLKIRMWFCVYLIGASIVIGLVFLFVVRSVAKDLIDSRTGQRYSDGAATSLGIAAFFRVLIPAAIEVAILYGYKKSFDDSLNILAPRQGGSQGPQGAGVPIGGASFPMNNYRGSPPVVIGGNTTNPYQPSPIPYQPMAFVPAQEPLPTAQLPGRDDRAPLPPEFTNIEVRNKPDAAKMR